MPDMLHSTSTRGRPFGSSSSRGISSYRATRPVPSFTARAPMSSSTIPTDSPFVLMASKPQRFTETVSGYAPVVSGAVLRQQRPRDALAAVRRRGAWHAVRVQRMDVAPGGEHARSVAKQIAARRRGGTRRLEPSARRSAPRCSWAEQLADLQSLVQPRQQPERSLVRRRAGHGASAASARSSDARSASTSSPRRARAAAATASPARPSPKYAPRYCSAASSEGRAPPSTQPLGEEPVLQHAEVREQLARVRLERCRGDERLRRRRVFGRTRFFVRREPLLRRSSTRSLAVSEVTRGGGDPFS